MSTLTIYKVIKGSFVYDLVYGDSNVKTTESKEFWTCTICNHCTSKDSNMLQISSDQRFHRICKDCLFEVGDFIDFCFGEGVAALCKKL